MNWSDIPAGYKIGSTGLAVVLSMMAYTATFHTDAEASELWEQHKKDIEQREIRQLESQISDKEFLLLDLDEEEDKRKVDFLKREIERLEAEKECIKEDDCDDEIG